MREPTLDIKEGAARWLLTGLLLVVMGITYRYYQPYSSFEISSSTALGLEGGLGAAVLLFTRRRRQPEKPKITYSDQLDISTVISGVNAFPLFVIDGSGVIRRWSCGCETLTGYSQREAIGQDYRILFPEEAQANRIPESDLFRTEQESVIQSEGWIITKERRLVWVERRITSVYAEGSGATSGDPRVRGFVCLLTDQTERENLRAALQKRAEELAESERCKDEFLSLLAHDLRNPLVPISGAAQLLKMKSNDTLGIQREVEMIDRGVDHMTRQINDLLDVTLLLRRRVTLDLKPLSLKGVVKTVVEAFKKSSEEKGVSLVMDGDAEESLDVLGDEDRLRQVVENILRNAEKFTPAGGKVHVALIREGDRVGVRVSDNGVGIPGDLLPHLNDMSQLNVPPEMKKGGLGIGLTLVNEVVKLHGGETRAHSPGVGKGATFEVLLPRSGSFATSPSLTTEGDVDPLRILIIDDNADTLRCLTELFRLIGHSVAAEYDGHGGIQRAVTFRPDVILCDIGLPGMSGYTVAEQLRSNPATRHMKLIAVSGYGSTEDIDRSVRAGFDAHVVKPPKMDQLQELIQRLMSNSRKETKD